MRIWLKNLRERNHLDIEQMAVKLEIDKKYYKHLEDGGAAFYDVDVPVLIAAKISEQFDIPISWLVLLESNRKRGVRNGQEEVGAV